MNQKISSIFLFVFFYYLGFHISLSYAGKKNAAESHKRVFGGRKKPKNLTLPVIPEIFCNDLIVMIKTKQNLISLNRQCNKYFSHPHQFEKDFSDLFDNTKKLIYFRTLQVVHEMQNGESYDLENIINTMKQNKALTLDAHYSLAKFFRNIQEYIEANSVDNTASALLLNKIEQDAKKIAKS